MGHCELRPQRLGIYSTCVWDKGKIAAYKLNNLTKTITGGIIQLTIKIIIIKSSLNGCSYREHITRTHQNKNMRRQNKLQSAYCPLLIPLLRLWKLLQLYMQASAVLTSRTVSSYCRGKDLSRRPGSAGRVRVVAGPAGTVVAGQGRVPLLAGSVAGSRLVGLGAGQSSLLAAEAH